MKRKESVAPAFDLKNYKNEYAKKLKDLGPLLWTARIGLLTVFVIHIILALRLNINARAARPIAYAHEQTVQASFAPVLILWIIVDSLLRQLLRRPLSSAIETSRAKSIKSSDRPIRDATNDFTSPNSFLLSILLPFLWRVAVTCLRYLLSSSDYSSSACRTHERFVALPGTFVAPRGF